MVGAVDEVRAQALALLQSHWDETRGHTCPNLKTYPHQWLWDSSFAAICWDEVGEPEKALRELTNVLAPQFADGFVPHIRYAGRGSGRGPRKDVSSFTQPPIFAHAARVLSRNQPIPAETLARIERALDWLWTRRRTPEGLLYLVHPWESGADDSPRWDTWAADFLRVKDWTKVRWTRASFTLLDRYLVSRAVYDAEGEAIGSRVFKSCPAAFNALASHAALEYAALTGDQAWEARGRELAAIMDESMWNDETGLWSDVPVLGRPDSRHIPTLDGVLGALVTPDADKAARAVDQLGSNDRFAAPFGLAYVARNHPAYDPQGYWRGAGWMQMNYLARLAAARCDRADIVDAIATTSVKVVSRSRFSEHWNVETGAGRGPTPLTWSALVATMTDR